MPERGSKTSTVPAVWATFGIFGGNPNNFLLRLVTMDKTWLYHYDPETKQQSMEWRHSGSSCPKKSTGKVLTSIFWDQDGILLIDHLPKGQTIYMEYSHLCWCNWRTFWRKNAVRRSQRRSCTCTTLHQLTRHLQPRRNWPTWASIVLITHPIPRIWPRWTTTCTLDWKNNWKVAFFLSDVEVIAAAETWLDEQLLNIFEQHAKVRAMG